MGPDLVPRGRLESCVVLREVKELVSGICGLDPFAKDDEEIVKEISWKGKLPLVSFAVDTKLWRGSLSRI